MCVRVLCVWRVLCVCFCDDVLTVIFGWDSSVAFVDAFSLSVEPGFGPTLVIAVCMCTP